MEGAFVIGRHERVVCVCEAVRDGGGEWDGVYAVEGVETRRVLYVATALLGPWEWCVCAISIIVSE